jgi:hypothetical protein
MLNRPKRDVYALPPSVNNIHTVFLCFLHRLLIVDAFLHPNGGINTAQQLRLIFAELGVPSISSSFNISRVHKAFDEDGRLVDEAYDKRVSKFLLPTPCRGLSCNSRFPTIIR